MVRRRTWGPPSVRPATGRWGRLPADLKRWGSASVSQARRQLARQIGRRYLLASGRVLARPQRREVSRAEALGFRAQRRDRRGRERELGSRLADRPELPQ